MRVPGERWHGHFTTPRLCHATSARKQLTRRILNATPGGIGAADSEPRSRFVRAVFVSELGSEHLLFLPCTIKLQWNEHHERTDKFRSTGDEKYSRERQSPKDVNGVSNSRIQTVRDERLRLGTH